jgi:hypothetical protein
VKKGMHGNKMEFKEEEREATVKKSVSGKSPGPGELLVKLLKAPVKRTKKEKRKKERKEGKGRENPRSKTIYLAAQEHSS